MPLSASAGMRRGACVRASLTPDEMTTPPERVLWRLMIRGRKLKAEAPRMRQGERCGGGERDDMRIGSFLLCMRGDR